MSDGGGQAGGRQWRQLPERDLLRLRVSALELEFEGSEVARLLQQVSSELQRAGLRFRPYAWLSSDWFTPDDLTGFAVPFTLADRRLVALERRQLLSVEGGTRDQCLRILRHETAHALDNAFGLHGTRAWRQTFGRFSSRYTPTYAPDPTSRDYVLNLSCWYGQSHPCEDWAETFAVWLDPASRWRTRYEGWPALQKLEAVDRMMAALVGRAPRRRTRRVEEPASKDHSTLEEHFARKRQALDEEPIPAMDEQLRRLFPSSAATKTPLASAFLRRHRRALVQGVAQPLGHHAYLVDQVVEEMILRCRHLKLRVTVPERTAQIACASLITALTSQFTYGGHPHYHR